MDIFVIKALIAGTGVAVIAGLLGCFVVWRRMSYFGDSLSHSALLGISLGFVSGLSENIATIIVCSFFAIILVFLQNKKILATDTLLGILAHFSLSLGLVSLSLSNKNIDLHAYLFGDILAVSLNDIYLVYIGGLFVILMIILNWHKLLLATINEDLAKAENINSFKIQILLMFLMTLVVAFSIKIVGILLINSMLIIPAAIARNTSNSPKSMAIFACLFAVISVFIGVFLSLKIDVPTGPMIVTILGSLFFIVFIFKNLLAFIKNND